MEINNKDITQGYQNLPKDELGFDITIHEEPDKDCICCWGDGDVQCCAGEHYYYDTCYCVLIKYWKKIGNIGIFILYWILNYVIIRHF